MDVEERLDGSSIERRLARELNEVRAAIEIVEVGTAQQVSLTGLRFGEHLLRRCRAEAVRRGVIIEPRWWPEDVGCDLLIRRTGDEP